MIIQFIRIGYNHDTGRKFGNLIVVFNQCLKKFQLGFSSKIKVPQLGSARNLQSSGSLEPENSSSNSSLVSMYSRGGYDGPRACTVLTLFPSIGFGVIVNFSRVFSYKDNWSVSMQRAVKQSATSMCSIKSSDGPVVNDLVTGSKNNTFL